ncbi:MAG: outer membrane beta-barrel protein [Pseudomonadota bacterium]
MRFFNYLAKSLFFACLLSAGLHHGAEAQERDVYWGVSAGASFPFNNGKGGDKVKFDTGFVGALQVGYLFDDVRTDFEVSYSRSDLDKIGGVSVEGDLQTIRASANLYFECNVPIFLVDCDEQIYYGGFGIGVAHQVLNDVLNDEETGLTAHGEVGISFESSRYLDLLTAFRVEWFETNLDGLDEKPLAAIFRIGTRFYY